MERKLASIQKIVSIDPIPDAEKIEKATVLGWEVVVAKADNFKPGDLVVYIEIDSVVPSDNPVFAFLADRKYRVRTIKLRKQVSQGLVLPIGELLPMGKGTYSEGTDVTDYLRITKYDPQGQLERQLAEEAAQKNKIVKFFSRYKWYRMLFGKKRKGGWPEFIVKTDEERIQNRPWLCEKEADTEFVVTEKLDGQSGTWFLVREPKKFLGIKYGTGFRFGVCSRNVYLRKENNSSYWDIARRYNMQYVLESLIGDWDFVYIQGEIVGPGIQKNKYKLSQNKVYVFNLVYPETKTGYSYMEHCLGELGITSVPFSGKFKLKPTVAENVELAKGKSFLNPEIHREGVVLRSYEKRISFKIINPDFLLKYEGDE